MAGVQRLAPCITCHAWNGSRSHVAICPNSNEVHIYKKGPGGFEFDTMLREHDSVVTSIDWAPRTNRILTCSQDRNANVWEFIDGKWVPHLVLLRINRAATHCKWSADEQKFAVCSGAKLLSVCKYDSDCYFWVSKHVKKHRSTITHVAWHPNGSLIATSSTDYKCRLVSVPIRGIDQRPDGGNWTQKPPNFGEIVFEFDCNSWVHSCAFSPSGNIIAFCGQDATMHFVWANNGQQPREQTIRMNRLPILDIMFVDENTLVGVGHDCQPLVFQSGSSGWALVRSLDEGKASASPAQGQNNNAFKMFKDTVDKGTTDSRATTTELNTKHQNAINCIRPLSSSGRVSDFSTSGLDGAIVTWKI